LGGAKKAKRRAGCIYKHCMNLAQLREMFLPYGCAICGKTLLQADEALFGICCDCVKHFSVEDVPRCEICGKPLISEQKKCMSCRKANLPPFDSAVVLYPYTGIYNILLKAYKFGKHKPLAYFFASKLKESIKLFSQNIDAVLVPVPPRAGKIKKTGSDQIEDIAKALETFKMPVKRCLKRLPSTSQKKLDRENRSTNLKGKIKCISTPEKNIILFDDVYTTGATLAACAQELKEAGAQKVYGMCLFYD